MKAINWSMARVVPVAFLVILGVLMVRDMPAAAEEPGLVFEHTCTPDTFRPNEWVVVECVARSTNQGQDTLIDIGWSVGGTYSGTLPDYFFVWSKRDGELQPANTGGLMFGGYDLRPGQTAETRTVLLLRMSEGTFETEADLTAKGLEVMRKPIRFVATADAAEPLRGLLVTHELVGGPAGEEAMPSATYETKITNEGSTAVTQLTVTDRYDEYSVFVSAEPAPSKRDPSVQLASWDLASFGKDSLAPGESLVLRTTYGPGEMTDCNWVSSGVVVEATVDGQQRRYGASAEDGALVGECDDEWIPDGEGESGEILDGGGGYEVPPEAMLVPGSPATGLPSGGEGPAGREVDVLWAVAVLAAGGASLVGAALALRRKMGR
jgi:hypothetical protein